MDDAGRRITDWPSDQRPRERLLRLGPDPLTDAEVLAVLIGSGRPGRTAIDVSRDLLTCQVPGLVETVISRPGGSEVGVCGLVGGLVLDWWT